MEELRAKDLPKQAPATVFDRGSQTAARPRARLSNAVKAVLLSSVLLGGLGGFVGYQKAQEHKFVNSFDYTLNQICREPQPYTSWDKYRVQLLALSKSSTLAMKQAFYEMDHDPERLRTEGPERHALRYLMSWSILQMAFVHIEGKQTHMSDYSSSNATILEDKSPWEEKEGAFRVSQNFRMPDGDFMPIYEEFERKFDRRDPSTY